MNFLSGKANADEQSVSIHHTFFGTAEHRSPEVGYYAFVDQRNNVAYNLNGGYVPLQEVTMIITTILETSIAE